MRVCGTEKQHVTGRTQNLLEGLRGVQVSSFNDERRQTKGNQDQRTEWPEPQAGANQGT